MIYFLLVFRHRISLGAKLVRDRGEYILTPIVGWNQHQHQSRFSTYFLSHSSTEYSCRFSMARNLVIKVRSVMLSQFFSLYRKTRLQRCKLGIDGVVGAIHNEKERLTTYACRCCTGRVAGLDNPRWRYSNPRQASRASRFEIEGSPSCSGRLL